MPSGALSLVQVAVFLAEDMPMHIRKLHNQAGLLQGFNPKCQEQQGHLDVQGGLEKHGKTISEIQKFVLWAPKINSKNMFTAKIPVVSAALIQWPMAGSIQAPTDLGHLGDFL